MSIRCRCLSGGQLLFALRIHVIVVRMIISGALLLQLRRTVPQQLELAPSYGEVSLSSLPVIHLWDVNSKNLEARRGERPNDMR